MLRKRLLSMIICLAICLPLLPNAAFAANTTRSVSTWEEFTAALADANVTAITVDGTIASPQLSKDDAFVIDSGGAVTITGGEITLKNAGIVLGRDVTFKDIKLYFSNSVRNAIIANGHALTLENVTSTGTFNISLFCGSVTNYCGSNSNEIPALGNLGHITVKGTNNLGNIYAGSLSDVGNGAADSPNKYTKEAIVTLDAGATGMGDIYAHGARENRIGGFPNDMFPDPDLYKATGGVTINLSNNTTNVYGSTGGESNAAVVFTDAGNGNLYSPLLDNIGSLALGAGCNMAPASGSSFSEDASVNVPEDARLNFSNIISPAIGSLNGGGTLVLGESQLLTIDGDVTGTTKVAVEDVNYDGTASTGTVTEGQAYLMAEAAAEDSFTLLPPSGKDLILRKEADGRWVAAKGGTTTDPKVASFLLGNVSADSGAYEAALPSTATDAAGNDISNELIFMDGITVSVNGANAPFEEEKGWYVSEAGLELSFTYNDARDGICLAVQPIDFTAAIPDGTYVISVTIPGAYTASEQSITASARLTVGEVAEEKTITEDMVSLSETSVTYNGKSQKPDVSVLDGTVPLIENTDYTVTYLRDGKETTDFTNAGTITVVVTGKGIYANAAEKSYTIQKAAAPSITWPTAQSLTYGQTLDSSALTGGSTNYGNFSWKSSDTVPNAGNGTYPVVFTPSPNITNNYEAIANTESDVSINVAKATPAISLSASVTKDGTATLKATLLKAGSGSFPTGTVKLLDITDSNNPQDIDSPIQVKADGTASLTWNVPENRKYTIQAVYSGDTNYETDTAEETIDTSKQSQAALVIISKTTVSYGQTLTLTTSGGSTNKEVTYTVSPADGAKISGNILTPSRAGDVTVIATMAGDDSYLDVTSAPVTIHIIKGTGTGSVTMANWTYGETASEPVPVSDTNGVDNVSYSYKQKGADDTSYTADKPVNAGNYTVRAVFAATANYTEAVATADFTINEKDNPGGDLPETPEDPTVKIPVSGGNTVNIGVKVDDTAATLGELTQKEAAALVDGTSSVVKIDLSTLSRKIDKVNLPFASIKTLTETAEKTNTEESLVIVLSTGTVTLDEKTMQTVVDQAQGSQVQLVLDNTGIKNLTDVQQNAIKDMKVYGCVEAYLICTQSGERISEFKGGAATLKIPFTIPEGLEASGFSVWYVDENGAKTQLNSSYKDGCIVWDVGHFSDFVIAYAESDNSDPGNSDTNTSGGQNGSGSNGNSGGQSGSSSNGNSGGQNSSNSSGGSSSQSSSNSNRDSGGNRTTSTSPRTGDSENPLLYMIMLIASAGLIGFVMISKKYVKK